MITWLPTITWRWSIVHWFKKPYYNGTITIATVTHSLQHTSSRNHHGDDDNPILSQQTSVTSELTENSSLSSLHPVKSLLSSLQLQQQKEEGVAEDAEGVANRHTNVCM